MRGSKLKGVLAAILTGAMVLSMPTAAFAQNVVTDAATVSAAVPVISGLNIVYENDSPYLAFNPIALGSGYGYARVEYSTDPSFPNTDVTEKGGWLYSDDLAEGRYYLSSYYFEPGTTYYVRLVVYSNGYYGGYSEAIAYTPEIPEAVVTESTVKSTSVNFLLNANGATGFEISRKINSKWKVIATISDNTYTDTGLTSNTTYSYRIRAYVYNKETNTKAYSSQYTYVTKTTWGGALNVKATATSNTKVKLTWTKVTGASGYKIYRRVGNEDGSEGSQLDTAKTKSQTYTSYKLIKTIKKAKTVSYTDKSLTAGTTYQYKVVAYKNKSGSKAAKTVEDTDSVTLAFDGWTNSGYDTYENSDGSVTATWKKINGAQGYIVQREVKQADGTFAWTTVDTLAASATSYTFVASADTTSVTNDCKIYVYSGNKYYYRTAYPSAVAVQAPGSVSAVANADGSISVSWAPVEGAAYYRVYRSTRLTSSNPDTGIYSRGANANTVYYVTKAGTESVLSADGTSYTNGEYPQYTPNIPASVTTIADQYIGYQYYTRDENGAIVSKVDDIQKAPTAGIRYYYYVQAYKGDGTPVNGEYEYYNSSAYTKPGSAIVTNTTIAKPTIKKVTAGKKKATVTWKKVAGAEKYLVYVSAKKNSGYSLAGVTTKTKLAVTGLTSGKTRYFKVVAVRSNEAGADVYSAKSAAKKAKIK